MQTDQEYKVQENRVRRMLRRQGYVLSKSRARDPRAIGYSQYHIANAGGLIVAGGSTHNGYGLNLDEAEAWATSR